MSSPSRTRTSRHRRGNRVGHGRGERAKSPDERRDRPLGHGKDFDESKGGLGGGRQLGRKPRRPPSGSARGAEASSDPACEPTLPARPRSGRFLIVRRDAPSGHPGAPAPPRRALVAGAVVALVACLLLLGSIAASVHEREASALDTLATQLFHGLANPTLDAVMRAITGLGSTAVVVPLFVLALALLLWRRHRREALFLAVALAGSWVINESLKLAVHRPRPQLDWAQVQSDFSFPSGHAMNSFVLYLALALIVWVIHGHRVGRIAIVVAVVLAMLIGVSRIYLGYHYLTDVVGGFLAGAAWLLLVSAGVGGAWLRRRRAGARFGP
jgi:undecaprenyl-diphosphatase